ncbi:hypothetical protein DSO57_1009243 [Entomophthora muscae]|uniref:Uncharacterized protein n=1 Tax=Entomophthora muscae TaxID=34485 RepID=A0ACC2THV9_9FUNG|nr:hypothetical protein DSO57_1009243 [Entomophthora muscae]
MKSAYIATGELNGYGYTGVNLMIKKGTSALPMDIINDKDFEKKIALTIHSSDYLQLRSDDSWESVNSKLLHVWVHLGGVKVEHELFKDGGNVTWVIEYQGIIQNNPNGHRFVIRREKEINANIFSQVLTCTSTTNLDELPSPEMSSLEEDSDSSYNEGVDRQAMTSLKRKHGIAVLDYLRAKRRFITKANAELEKEGNSIHAEELDRLEQELVAMDQAGIRVYEAFLSFNKESHFKGLEDLNKELDEIREAGMNATNTMFIYWSTKYGFIQDAHIIPEETDKQRCDKVLKKLKK